MHPVNDFFLTGMQAKSSFLLRIKILLILLFPVVVFAQPTANFTANNTTGCSPFSLVVNFQDISTGNPTGYLWQFGDASNSTSTLANPTFVYSGAGCYDVTLIVTNAGGTDTLTQTCFVEIYPQPIPGFIPSNTSGCAPMTVTFTDTSVSNGGTITNWQWTLSDGSPGTGPTPSFTFPTAPDTIGVVLTVTNSNGCQNTAVFPNLITVADPPVVDFAPDVNSSCNPPLTVNFTNNTQINGAINPTYTWLFPGGQTPGGQNNSNQQNPPPITYTADGQYDVTLIVASANGCADTLVQPALIGVGGVVASFTASSNVICLGDTIDFVNTSTGGVSSLEWNFGETAGVDATTTTASYVYTTPGTYSVTLRANNSQCGDTLVMTNLIVVDPVPVANFSIDHDEDCQPGIPFAFTDLSSGANTYAWDFGDTNTSNQASPTHTYATFGTYTVCLTVTNTFGCTDVFCDTITIAPPAVAFNRNPSEGCAPLTVAFNDNSSSPNDPIISWNWDFGGAGAAPPTSMNQNDTVVFATPGTYDASLIIVTQSGCTDTVFLNNAVTVGDPPMSDFIVDKDTVCINEFITFTATTQNNNWDYYWDFGYTPPGAFNLFDTIATTIYPDTGLYNVALYVEDRGCRDTTIKNDLVFVSPPRAQFSVSDTVVCQIPTTITITDESLGPADVYEWRLNGNVYSNLQNPPDLVIANPGSYLLTQIIENSLSGCIDTFTVLIGAGNPIADFEAVDTVGCADFTTQFLNLSQNYIGSTWRLDHPNNTPGYSTITQNPIRTYFDPGFYSMQLIIIDQFGCTDTLVRNNYLDVRGPTVNFGANPMGGCPPLLVQFSDSTTTTPATTPVAWEWDFGDGSPVSTQQNPSHNYANAGSYTVKLTVTDSDGCIDSLEIPNFVNVTFPSPSFQVIDDSTCAGNLVSFNNISQGTGLSYMWDFGDGMGSTFIANPTYAYSDTGFYDVTLTATDVNGCVDSFTIVNAVYIEPFEANFGGDPTIGICPPLNTQFTDSTIGNVVAWNWDFGDGFGLSQLQNPAYVYFQPGSFDVTLIATHEDGCQDTLTRSGYVQLAGPNGSFIVDPPNACLGDSICITAVTTGAAIATVDYRDGNVDVRTNLTGIADTIFSCHLYQTPGQFSPVIVLQDAQGCVFTLTTPDTTTIYSLPGANINPIDTVGCVPFTIPFTDASSQGDTTITQWFWQFGNGDTSTAQNPFYTYLADSVYEVKLTVLDGNGCVDSTATSVTAFEGTVADFEASDTLGCAPIAINFTDLSTNVAPTDWTWIFGDGDTITGVANPVHTYLTDGIYTVTLIVSDGLGCSDTLTIPNYIELRHPQAEIYSSVTQGCNPLVVTFYGDSSASSSPIVQYEWCLTDLNTGQVTCQTTTVDTFNVNFLDPGNFEMTLAITDDLGCSDTSTVQTLNIDPRMIPPPIEILNVSVTGDESVQITWDPYPDVDFVEYAVYRVEGQNATLLGNITNQNTTTFTETGTGLDTRNNSYCYKVLVQNLCLEYSILTETEEHCTIDLITTPDIDAIVLDWSAYVGFPVDEYEIYLADDYNPGNHTQIATVPGTELTYTDTATFCRDSISYRVRAVGFIPANQLSFSDLSADAPIHPDPVEEINVIYATVVGDSVVEVSWPQYDGYLPDNYVIERSLDGAAWSAIDTVPYGTQLLVDEDVVVDELSYYYRVFNIDQCGDRSARGFIGRTIHLSVIMSRTGEIPNLTWNPYEEWGNGVQNYRIEVLNELTGMFEFVADVPATTTSFSDDQTNLNQATYCYRIVATEVGGNGAQSVSNEACVIFSPDIFAPSAFSPNDDGTNDIFQIFTPNIATGELTIFNRWGQAIYRSADLSQGWDGTFNGKAVQEGVYVFVVTVTGVDGSTVTRQGTVTLIR